MSREHDHGMPRIADLLVLLRTLLADRHQLLAENLALRHQLGVLKRSVPRPKIEDSDRLIWILLRRSFKDWKDALIFVKPDTVVRWHRNGFRYYWKRKSRAKPGRPPISMGVIMLIRRHVQENLTWGAPRPATTSGSSSPESRVRSGARRSKSMATA